jgi:hypothetical protein
VDKCPEDGCLKVKFAGKKIFSSKYTSQKSEDLRDNKEGEINDSVLEQKLKKTERKKKKK